MEIMEPIDTRKQYNASDLFSTHGLPFTVNTLEPYLVPLSPKVSVPADLGILLLPEIPTHEKSFMFTPDPARLNFDRQMVAAGWVDSGYSGSITAQPWFFRQNQMIRPGRLMALGLAFEYFRPVDRLYGKVSNTPRAQLYGSKQ
jgi:hypothetical protein